MSILCSVTLRVLLPALVLFGLLAGGPAPAEIVKPPALQPGGTVALVAPARPQSETVVARVETLLGEQGYTVLRAPNVTTNWGGFAGTDEERAEILMDMWRNPEVDALFSVTGGYGTTRMVDQLDFDYIRENPKILAGFSDITGLHLAIYRKAGIVTFHSPNTSWVYGRAEEERPFAVEAFWRAIAAESYPTGSEAAPGWTIPLSEPSTPVETISPGRATGRLVGGNLSLVHALMGTPYEIETRGHILFLEDVNEAAYRIDRMLSTLRLAGKLDEVEGVVLGRFTRVGDEDYEDRFTAREVFEQYFADRPYPVVYNFPTGHVQDNAALPIGVLAELDAGAGTLTLLEDPVTLPEEE